MVIELHLLNKGYMLPSNSLLQNKVNHWHLLQKLDKVIKNFESQN